MVDYVGFCLMVTFWCRVVPHQERCRVIGTAECSQNDVVVRMLWLNASSDYFSHCFNLFFVSGSIRYVMIDYDFAVAIVVVAVVIAVVVIVVAVIVIASIIIVAGASPAAATVVVVVVAVVVVVVVVVVILSSVLLFIHIVYSCFPYHIFNHFILESIVC